MEDFESAIRTVCEPIFGKPIKDISFGFFLLRLFQIARRFRYEVQPQLVLLQKTLLQVEGLGRQLDPDLDLWKTAKPIMEDWMRDRLSPAKLSSALRAQLPLVIEALPRLAEQSLLRAERADEIGTSARLAQLERQLAEGQRRTRRTVVAATFTLLTVALGWMLSQDVALPGGNGAVWLSAGLAAWSWWRAR